MKNILKLYKIHDWALHVKLKPKVTGATFMEVLKFCFGANIIKKSEKSIALI